MIDSLPPRSYAYDTLYTEAEIAQRGHHIDLLPADWPGELGDVDYLISRGDDGLEYWFRRLYDLWYVDHTWGLFILGRKKNPK